MEEHKDFLTTELLHELKLESERKDRQLGNLHKILTRVVIGALCAILMVVGCTTCKMILNSSSASPGTLSRILMRNP